MQKIAILYDASQAVLSTFDLDEVLQQILRIVRDYFQLQNGAILLLDPETNHLVMRCQAGWDEEHSNMSIPLGEGLIGTAAKLKRPTYSPDVLNDPRYICSRQETRSELAIPLMLQDQVVGVLDCQSDETAFFDRDMLDLLTLFSTQASIAIQNAQLYALERRRAAQLEAINLIARQTTAVTDIRELLGKACDLILQSFSADHVAVLLREGDDLVFRSHAGRLTPKLGVGDRLPSTPGVCTQALAANAPVVVDDVTATANYVPGFTETRSELVLPLISFGHAIGVLTLESAEPHHFRKADVGPMESVADICAAAIQNANYFDQVRQLAYRDGLTGVFNRRHFEARILDEVERARRYNLVLSVLMVDIDGFKKLNDEFGHLLGDEVLKQVSTMFLHQTRKSDVVCRYGGDEFAVLLPETSGRKAAAVAEKLRAKVSAWEFPGVPRPVTISTGIAEFPRQGSNRDELMKAADLALYSAKQSGRNQVVFCDSQD
ncbi:MAG TPA: sensor domain-containing diguanylate cyclase [Terriglobales bacterium]|nr:sensor domain-containing diguanylate cyclase [Terriglobales bacterium]